MIIFLYGQDVYRSRKKLREIIEHYEKVRKSGLNLKVFDLFAQVFSFQDFKDVIRSASMFKEKKLIILKNIFSSSDFQEKFLKEKEKYLKSEDVILFYCEEKIAANKPLFKFLKQRAKAQEFKLLEGIELKNWLRREFKSYNSRISPEALEKLIAFVGNDLWRFSNEIRKLVSFKNKKQIERQDVELLVKPKIETDIFKTIDAIALRNKNQALKFLHKHLEKGDSPLYLLSMINFQFRNLLMVKEQSRPVGMHPYVARKSMEQARKFSLEELKKIYLKIFQADLSIKTGRIEAGAALDLLVTGI
ncbi:DNA polymerase III subunit delta [Candidatus Parcubacteria bacterium]|nr:DNA polymerase III subunit delta [Candidatus Parcubacteria bacterium]